METQQVQEVGFQIFKVVPAGAEGEPRSQCGGCGWFIWSDGGYRIPGLAGTYCTVECIETALFGTGHCRWCGSDMDKAYTFVDSRLCSEGCSQSYYDHVLGDRSAALGTGKRFMPWLQEHQPAVYERLTGQEPAQEQQALKPGRPRKYKSESAARRGAARRVREHRHRQEATLVGQDVTKNPSETRINIGD